MSEMLARTWTYIQGLGAEPGWGVPTDTQKHSLPPGLASWLQQVTSCLTREEEQLLVTRQLDLLQAKLSQPGLKPGILTDCVVRVVFMTLLGYDCSTLFIYCVKLAGSESILQRKMGYLACSLVVPGTNQLSLLVTNCILRDLGSTSLVDIQLGLVATANIVQQPLAELVPVLAPRVRGLVGHTSPLVRKKALVVLHHLCTLSPSLWAASVAPTVVGVMSDPNPGVVTTALQVTARMGSLDEATAASALVAALHLQTQLEGDKLPDDFIYQNKHSAPWVRMDLARLFRALRCQVEARPDISSQVKTILTRTLEQAGGRDMVEQALLHETILTVAELEICQQDHHLQTLALRQVSAMLQSRQHSLIYTGLVSLQALFSRQPPLLTKEQEGVVMSCLAHPDPAIQRRTVELMVVLATNGNVASVVDTIISYIRGQGDKEGLGQVIDQVAGLVDKWSESTDWRASTLLRLVQVSRGQQRDQMEEKLKFLLAPQGGGEVDPATELELNRVRDKLRSLLSGLVTRGQEKGGKPAPSVVVRLYVWCEGQFVNEDSDVTEVMGRVLSLGRSHLEAGESQIVEQCLWTVQRLSNLVNTNTSPEEQGGQEEQMGQVQLFVKECSRSEDITVRRTARDVMKLVSSQIEGGKHSTAQGPHDWTLSFLDSVVIKHLEAGDRTFVPKSLRKLAPKSQRSYSSSERPLNLAPYSHLQATHSPGTSLSSSSGDTAQLWTMQGRLGDQEESKEGDQVDTSEVTPPPIEGGGRASGLYSVLAEEWS